MKTPEIARPTAEETRDNPDTQRYVLQLYIAGRTEKSMLAIANTRRLCDTFLAGRYQLDIVDIYQCPALAQKAKIIATPTLVRTLPLPVRRIIGEMHDAQRIMVVVDRAPKEKTDTP